MEDIIDIGRYIRALVRRWPVILLLTLVGALVGYGVSRLLPPVYEASSMLLITTPKFRADFDTRFRSTLELGLNRDLSRTFFNLLINPELERRVSQRLSDRFTEEERKPGALATHIRTRQIGGDSSFLAVFAQADTPEKAQELANLWAEVYVNQINELYGLPSQADQDIEASLAEAKANLKQAEAALEAFQAQTGVGLVDNVQYPASLSRQTGLTQQQNLFGLYERYGARGQELEQMNLTLGSYLAALDVLDFLIGEAESLAASRGSTGADLPLEMLNQGVLQQRGQLDVATLRAAPLAKVLAALQGEREALRQTVDRLQAQLQQLQGELAAKSRELANLVRQRKLAEESYLIFSLKQAELNTRSKIQDSWFEIVSKADMPTTPVAPRPLLSSAVGTVLGFLMGVLAALLLEARWGTLRAPTHSPRPMPS